MPILFIALAAATPAAGQIKADGPTPIGKSAASPALSGNSQFTKQLKKRITLDHLPAELVTFAAPPGWSFALAMFAPTPSTLAVSRSAQLPVSRCPSPFYDRIDLTRAITRGFRIVSWTGAPVAKKTEIPEVSMEIVATDAAGNDVSSRPSDATGIRVRPPLYTYQYPGNKGCISSYYLNITLEGPIGIDPLTANFSPRRRH